jgi:hypothetical protein
MSQTGVRLPKCPWMYVVAQARYVPLTPFEGASAGSGCLQAASIVGE